MMGSGRMAIFPAHFSVSFSGFRRAFIPSVPRASERTRPLALFLSQLTSFHLVWYETE